MKPLFVLVSILWACHLIPCQIITTVTQLPSGPITFPFPITTDTPTIIFIPTGTITFVLPGGKPTSLPPGAGPSTTDGDGDMPEPTPESKPATYNPVRGEKFKVGGHIRSSDGLEADFEADASDDNGDDDGGCRSSGTDDAFTGL
ncbi:uncharacterized protein PgNI_02565 [Pyricularia grisea]|uniref:Uncharacterized protein n=1 Tax=Pyricularia grisea TaxID=148305 RepID=A0A6P8BM28_PYRGI|nr:uncharacterized protein PgNI_02565 [Pyricularia grisea]TLD17690.1 hypothetical protein PgNI_02565 [Pyricularia grisea]